MKPRKPDRFERVVREKSWTCMDITDSRKSETGVWSDDVVTLLRNEHAWMRRMVKKVDAWASQELADNDDVIAEILKQLAQRRK